MSAPTEYTGVPSSLVTCPIDIACVRTDAYKELTNVLEMLEGSICLVLDPKLSNPMKLIVTEGSRMLREHRVEEVHELAGRGVPITLAAETDTVLFVVRPTSATLRLVAAQVHAWKRRLTITAGGVSSGAARGPRHVAVALAPRKTFLGEQFFKDEGLYDDISIMEYALDMIPLDDDVMTLNMDSAFADVNVHGDASSLYAVTRSLLKLQAVFGPIPTIRAKGPAARTVVDLMLRLRREADGQTGASSAQPTASPADRITPVTGAVTPTTAADELSSMPSGTSNVTVYLTRDPSMPLRGEIHSCIILDRVVDMVTPMVSPLTLEAQLDEIFGIDCAMATVDSALIRDADDDADDEMPMPATKGGKAPAPKPRLPDQVPLHLNSNSKLYAEIRDNNIAVAGPKLTARAKELQAMRDSITKANKDALKVADIKRFVKNIPGLQADMRALKVMIGLTSQVQRETNDAKFMERWQLERSILDEENMKDVYDAVQAAIAKREPLVKTMRLLCLLCAVEGGIKQKQLDGLRHGIIASYGFETVLTLRALESCGMLWGKEGGSGLGAAFSSVGATTSNWGQLRKMLALTADNPDVEDPKDLHFVTSGYAPLSIRLVQAAMPGGMGWETGVLADALRLLPGPQFNITQVVRAAADSSGGGTTADGDAETGMGTGRSERKVVLVVFVGGVTHIEISCLRHLAERNPADFIVLATAVINGSKLVSSIVTPFENGMATLSPPPPGPPAEASPAAGARGATGPAAAATGGR